MLSLHLEENDVLIQRAGTLGKASIVQKEDLPSTANQNLVQVKINKHRINPFYLTCYLNCKHGIANFERLQTGNVQPWLNLHQIHNLPIPHLTNDFQCGIEQIVKNSFCSMEKSTLLYQQAQDILLAELGLKNWKPAHRLYFVKRYSDTQQAGRIDAEYFQPKYDDIINAIKTYKGGWDTLGNVVSMKKCIEVGSQEYQDEGVAFIRVSNLYPFEITEEKYISESLYFQIKQHQPQKGEILLSKDATPGIAHYIDETPKRCIPSGGILRLKNKHDSVNSEYLTAILNSVLTKEQANRDVGGSVILHWRPGQIQKIIIPILAQSKQQEIQQKIAESFALRKKSKQLLETAKRAVEIAIEQGETAAMQWLESQ